MIKSINKEPIIKRSIILSSVLIIISIIILNIIHINQLNLIYNKQMDVTNRIIGALIVKYPGEELEIIDALKEDNKDISLKGKEIINRYGYNENNIFKDNNFKDYSNKSVFLFLIISLLVVIINIFLFNIIFKKFIEFAQSISDYIDNFINDNYKVNEEIEEGVFSGVISRLSDLGKKLDVERNKLKCERDDLKELVTDISHQLKTPLASLKLYNSILKEEINEEDRKIFLDKNEGVISKLHNLIDALINISRLESKMIEIREENKSIKQTIVKAINSLYLKAMDKNINISVDEFEDIKLYHDPKWTEEAIFNVVDNAVKYTQKGGHINISTSKSINYFRIDIKDNGIGIEKNEINNVFKRFYRVNNDMVKNTEGSGVGLYLSRKILQAQGGNIICNKNIDKGATFSLLLQKCNI